MMPDLVAEVSPCLRLEEETNGLLLQEETAVIGLGYRRMDGLDNPDSILSGLV